LFIVIIWLGYKLKLFYARKDQECIEKIAEKYKNRAK
jgi:hypothetical protein